MRFILALLTLSLIAADPPGPLGWKLSPRYAAAQVKEPAAELKIVGDVKVVEVERTIIVREPMQVVGKLPFTVQAPAGAFDYRWRYPSNITAKDDDSEALEITAAPKGALTVSCRVTHIRVENGAVIPTRKTLTLVFAVGEVVPPKPPNPPDAFTQSLIDAYRTDTTADKAAIVAFFASLYRAAAATDVNDQSLTKLGELYARLVSARKRAYPDDAVILPIRKLIETELNALVKPVVDQPLDSSTRTKVAAAFNRVAAALEAVK